MLPGRSIPRRIGGNAVAPLDGLSLAPTFRGQRRTLHDALFWEHEGNKAVRKGKWKLVSRFEKRTWELYDLDADRSEVHDLAAQEPDRVREMTALYDAWAERCGVVPFERLPRPVAQSAAG